MNFALPLALLALGLVALPVIAHYVRRSQTPRRALPTIRLLERAIAESDQKKRLDDRWLFALRALAVLLAALAAAAPFVQVPIELGDGRASAIAFVLDASRSMQSRDGTTPLFERARDRALASLDELPDGSEITVVLATTPPTILADRTLDSATARRALEGFDAARVTGGDTLEGAVRAAHRRLHASTLAVRRMVVYSDFAAHVNLDPSVVGAGVATDYVRLGEPQPANASLELVSIRADVRDPTTRIVTLRARSAEARLDATVRLDVEGRNVDERRVRTTAEGTLIELTARRVRGTPDARAVADFEDAFPEDDEVPFALATPRETRVLMVDGEPSADRFEDEVALAARALELVPQTEHRFEVTRVHADALTTDELARHDVIVLANVPTLGATVASALRARLDAGVGLLVAPGDRTDGRALTQAFSGVLPARLGVHGACGERSGVTVRDAIDGLNVRGLSATRFASCTEVDPVLGRSRVPLTTSDGTPLLVVGDAGRSRVAVLGTSLDAEGSDLPLSGGFLPLLGWLVPYLDRADGTMVTTQQSGSFLTTRDTTARIVTPSGGELGPTEGRIGPLQELGAHRLVIGDATPEPFTVVAPTAESELGAGRVPGATNGQRRGGGRAYLKRDVSSWFFALFGLCVVAEGVYRETQRGRRRASTTRSTAP